MSSTITKKILETIGLTLLFILVYRFPATSGNGYIEALAVILFPIVLSILVFKGRHLGWIYLSILLGWSALLYWVPTTIAVKGPLNYPLAITLSWLLYSWEAAGLLVVIICSRWFYYHTNPLATACSTAIAMVLLEVFGFHVYPWSWGAALGGIPWLAKAAAFLGTHGLTAIIWLCGFWIGAKLVKSNYQIKYFLLGLLPLVVTFTLLPLAWYKLPRGNKYSLNVVMIQPNFKAGLISPNMEQDMWQRSDAKLKAMGWPNDHTTTLLLWPESSILGQDYSQPTLRTQLEAKRRNVIWLFGASDSSFNLVRGEALGNSFVQAKVNLMPFGERMPGSKTISQWLDQKLGFISQQSGTLTKNSSFIVNTSQGIMTIHPIICCEAMISCRVQSGIKIAGGDLITNHTNDGWFEQSPATDLHAAEIRLRAVENGIPLLRSTLTGKSGIFREDGSWLLWDKPLTEGAYALQLQWYPINTPARNPIVLKILIALLLLICIFSIAISRKTSAVKSFVS